MVVTNQMANLIALKRQREAASAAAKRAQIQAFMGGFGSIGNAMQQKKLMEQEQERYRQEQEWRQKEFELKQKQMRYAQTADLLERQREGQNQQLQLMAKLAGSGVEIPESMYESLGPGLKPMMESLAGEARDKREYERKLRELQMENERVRLNQSQQALRQKASEQAIASNPLMQLPNMMEELGRRGKEQADYDLTQARTKEVEARTKAIMEGKGDGLDSQGVYAWNNTIKTMLREDEMGNLETPGQMISRLEQEGDLTSLELLANAAAKAGYDSALVRLYEIIQGLRESRQRRIERISSGDARALMPWD